MGRGKGARLDPERTELSRVAVDGVDPRDGGRVEVIAARYADGWELYVPAASHIVRLDRHAVAQLANAMAPCALTEIVVGVRDATGEWVVLPASVSHGREVSDRSISGMLAALRAARKRLKNFGWAPPLDRPA